MSWVIKRTKAGLSGGFPEGVAIANGRVYVAGPATFGTAGKGPSVVTVLRLSNGNLITEIPIQGENLAFEHAISGLAVDGDDRVYVLSTQLGVVRLERHGNTYTQTSYAPPLPDLPVCAPIPVPPCSPTFIDLPPLPNEMAFDDDGFLYVTDSLQATIFRVPPGGGSVEIWFQSPLLAGSLLAPLPFGANGIRVSPDRDFVYVVVSFHATNPSLGRVYRIPLVNAPGPGDIQLVHTFTGGVVPVRHQAVANAVGAAIAQVSGEVDQIFQNLSRDAAIAEARRLAEARAVSAGANRATLEVVDVEDLPLAYLPGNSLRVRVRVVGDIAAR